ncbi:sensor histidine kinase [Nonomuraea sp. NPDC049714]|uniref:sensor histidine kinase n=1 Tax=Nonomuraea sp. NPDC049714 TaxID=3364357 RepID=UPI0037AE8C4A
MPRRPATVRWRFTVMYAGVILASAVGLLVISDLIGLSGTRVSETAPVGNAPGGPTLAAAQELIAQLSEAREAQSRQTLIGSAVALAVVAVLSPVLGHLIAGRVLLPLRTITTATRRISADNLHERLAVPGPADEVKDLADTIDDLLGRLEGAFAAQRRFVADASHELRTPLATMRASLDVAVAKPGPVPVQILDLADRLRTELDQVDRLLDGFLTLARAQHGALVDRQEVSLGRLVSAALDARAADLAAKNLTVNGGDPDDAWTRGSTTLLSRMVGNVIDNAIVHNHEHGWIRVTVTSGATLVVETGGRVLDQAQVARLAEPFQRLAADRTGSDTGSGLGLSIVAAIATAHGGALDLHARPEGGLRATVTLPPSEVRA